MGFVVSGYPPRKARARFYGFGISLTILYFSSQWCDKMTFYLPPRTQFDKDRVLGNHHSSQVFTPNETRSPERKADP